MQVAKANFVMTIAPSYVDIGRPFSFFSICLKLHDMNQIFNSMNPSSFIEKELDEDAEEFIISCAMNSLGASAAE